MELISPILIRKRSVMNTINVHYFASLREMARMNSEELLFEGTCRELYESLVQKYHFTLPTEMVMVAINDEFSHMDQVVKAGSKVVFIPPVAGG